MSYSIAVRALCEFTAKVGDLDLRFTPSPTALKASSATGRWRPGAATDIRVKSRLKASIKR